LAYYKIFYSLAASKVIYFRYVQANGTAQSSSNYHSTVHGANDSSSSGSEHNVWGYDSQDKGLYHWWDGSDDKPAYCEINLFHPYDSTKCTADFYHCTWYYGNKVGYQGGANIYLTAESHRGVHLYVNSGSHIDTDFTYLVLGAS